MVLNVTRADAPAASAAAADEVQVARAGGYERPPTTSAPVRDKLTGLCTWQALATVPTGRWVTEAEAAQYFRDSSSAHQHYPPYTGMHRACASKSGWYTCPNFAHTKQWLPDLVRERRCAMTYLTPPTLHNITRRPLRILLHGDSLFKGLYKAFVCQWSHFVKDEENVSFEDTSAEGWIAHLANGFELQYIYRDNAFEHTARTARTSGFRDMDEFDVLVTNFGNITTYHRIAQERGYNGVLVHASHACARCHKGSAARCHYGTLVKQTAQRTLGYITLDLCSLTLPQHNYSAMWSPAGKPMNRADPHLCSPGPDNQLMNILLHMLASYFRSTA